MPLLLFFYMNIKVEEDYRDDEPKQYTAKAVGQTTDKKLRHQPTKLDIFKSGHHRV